MIEYPRVLTIAGSDSGGGAGIQADLKTFQALGAYGMSVITALTAQNTKAVEAIYPVEARFVREQLAAVLLDIGAQAIKTGMLFDTRTIKEVAAALRNYSPVPLVIDPVMLAKSGDLLLKNEAIEALKHELFPLARLVTPNLEEASKLLGRALKTRQDMEEASREFLLSGCEAVLIKGGHLLSSTADDCFYSRGSKKPRWFVSERIDTSNTHGTGCTLASAIAVYLAKGLPLEDSIARAKDYLVAALIAGSKYKIGEGCGPLCH